MFEVVPRPARSSRRELLVDGLQQALVLVQGSRLRVCLCGGGSGAAGRSAGAASPGGSRPSRRPRPVRHGRRRAPIPGTVPPPGPGASARALDPSRRGSSSRRPGRPRCSTCGFHTLFAWSSGSIARRPGDPHRSAVAAQQQRHARQGALDPEQAADQCRGPAQCPPLVIGIPCAAGPRPSSASDCANVVPSNRVRTLGPQRLWPALPPRSAPLLHLPRTDPQPRSDPRIRSALTEALRGPHPNLLPALTARAGHPAVLRHLAAPTGTRKPHANGRPLTRPP